jgi:hypothetical protein
MSISAELLIFSTRASSFFWCSSPPSPYLLFSVLLGCIIISIFAGQIPYFGGLSVKDICIIWTYDIICFILIDTCKVIYFYVTEQSTSVLVELEDEKESIEIETPSHHIDTIPTSILPSLLPPPVKDLEKGIHKFSSDLSIENKPIGETRAAAMTSKLHDWTNEKGFGDGSESRPTSQSNIYATKGMSTADIQADRRTSSNAISAHRKPSSIAIQAARQNSSSNISMPRQGSNIAIYATRRNTGTGLSAAGGQPSTENNTSSITVSNNYYHSGSVIDLRRSNLSTTNLRPHTPGNVLLKPKK